MSSQQELDPAWEALSDLEKAARIQYWRDFREFGSEAKYGEGTSRYAQAPYPPHGVE